jgi:glycosyltransferase involved in cell wall biosynthesis
MAASKTYSSLIHYDRLAMISIVVPAHNESSVIARTLRPWVTGPASDEISVVVVCNGCTDDTASVARSFGPTVASIKATSWRWHLRPRST